MWHRTWRSWGTLDHSSHRCRDQRLESVNEQVLRRAREEHRRNWQEYQKVRTDWVAPGRIGGTHPRIARRPGASRPTARERLRHGLGQHPRLGRADLRARPGFSQRAMIEEPEGLVGVDRIQPTLFGVQVALAALWRSWDVEPVAVIGRSLGEVAAAVVAGVLSTEDGVKVICRRATLPAHIAHGAMASVMLGADETRAAIEADGADAVSLGVPTSPGPSVVSADAAQIRALVDTWNEQGTVTDL
ncbi:acyltransferase domain-containing protein [Streptomyces spiralis]